FGLFDKGVAEYLPGKVLCDAADFLQSLIDGHGADGHGRIADDPFADIVDVAAGGEVHHGVRAPARGPDHFLHLLGHGGGDGGIADIGVDLDQEIAADDHRLAFRVIDIGRNDGPAARHLVAYEFGRDMIRYRCAKTLTVALQCGARPLAAEILADGDEFHFRRDDAGPRISELGDCLAVLGPEWPV